MAGITLEVAEARLQQYIDAEQKVLFGQKVDMFGRMLTRADLAAIQQGIAIWQRRVNNLAAGGGIRVVEVIPR